jgi:hypothetical protein
MVAMSANRFMSGTSANGKGATQGFSVRRAREHPSRLAASVIGRET